MEGGILKTIGQYVGQGTSRENVFPLYVTVVLVVSHIFNLDVDTCSAFGLRLFSGD